MNGDSSVHHFQVAVGFTLAAVAIAGCASDGVGASPSPVRSSSTTTATPEPTTTPAAGMPEATTPAATTIGMTPRRSSSRVTPPAATTQPPQPPPVRLPAGRVPSEAVGTWTGGEGAKTGEFLLIESAGSYTRIDRNGQTYRQGVIVANGNEFVTYDADGRPESGSWSYTNAAGIEVLGVYFGS